MSPILNLGTSGLIDHDQGTGDLWLITRHWEIDLEKTDDSIEHKERRPYYRQFEKKRRKK